VLRCQVCGKDSEPVVGTHGSPRRLLFKTTLFRGFLVQYTDGQASQERHVLTPMTPSNARLILAPGDIKHPVQLILGWCILAKDRGKARVFPFCQLLSGLAVVVMDEQPDRTDVIL
jgi:hypothetical protein